MECPSCGNNFPPEELNQGECSDCIHKGNQLAATVVIVCGIVLLFSLVIIFF